VKLKNEVNSYLWTVSNAGKWLWWDEILVICTYKVSLNDNSIRYDNNIPEINMLHVLSGPFNSETGVLPDVVVQ